MSFFDHYRDARSRPKLAPPRRGRPLEDGLPPPGLRSELSKKEKEGAQGRETKEKEVERRRNRLKDSADTEPNPTTSYAPDVMQPKASPESSVQRTHSSFHDHERDSSAPRLPDTSDSRGKVGPSSDSAPPLDRRETPITPSSASISTQNQPKHVVGVRSINDGNSTISSTIPLPRPPSLPGDSQSLATSSDKSSIVLTTFRLTADTMSCLYHL
jgi:hypothetical protein